MITSQCVFCGQQVKLVHVHGHYQCPVCKTNAMPCCDGDNCDTNVLLKNNEEQKTCMPGNHASDILSINSNGSTGSHYH